MPLGALGGHYNHCHRNPELYLQWSTAMEPAFIRCSLFQKDSFFPNVSVANSYLLELFESPGRAWLRAFGLDTGNSLMKVCQ